MGRSFLVALLWDEGPGVTKNSQKKVEESFKKCIFFKFYFFFNCLFKSQILKWSPQVQDMQMLRGEARALLLPRMPHHTAPASNRHPEPSPPPMHTGVQAGTGHPRAVARSCLTIAGFFGGTSFASSFLSYILKSITPANNPLLSASSSGESSNTGELCTHGQRLHGKLVTEEGLKPLAGSSVVSSHCLL